MTDNPLIPSDRDWPEDFPHENGNYLCRCLTCANTFTGHKRRYVCKVCAETDRIRWESLTPEEQEREEAIFLEKAHELFKRLDMEEKAKQSESC